MEPTSFSLGAEWYLPAHSLVRSNAALCCAAAALPPLTTDAMGEAKDSDCMDEFKEEVGAAAGAGDVGAAAAPGGGGLALGGREAAAAEEAEGAAAAVAEAKEGEDALL